MPERDAADVRDALQRVLADAGLRERLTAEGRATATSYAWPTKLAELDAHYRRLADGSKP
jgi:hypothetical protein